jgi:putative methyltransferase (TIGR04325 family)
MIFKQLLQALTPPFLWTIGKDLKRRMLRSVDYLEYVSPEKLESAHLPTGHSNHDFWTRSMSQDSPVLSCIDREHVIFGYVVALAAIDHRTIAVLDYGGGVGDYFLVGKALVPSAELEFHCKELPAIAAAGHALNPSVTWHTDDQCLSRKYDVVMFSSSLQYVSDWQDTLARAAPCARRYLLLGGLPCVRNVASFIATQRSAGMTIFHHLLNRAEIIGVAEHNGLRLIREFEMCAYPPVANAPEQPRSLSLLFQRG